MDIGGARTERARAGERSRPAGGPEPVCGAGIPTGTAFGNDQTPGTATLTKKEVRIAQPKAEKAARQEQNDRAMARRVEAFAVRAGIR